MLNNSKRETVNGETFCRQVKPSKEQHSISLQILCSLTVNCVILKLHSLCVSQLFARRHGVLLGPVIATHTPPPGAFVVHLQNAGLCYQAHWNNTHTTTHVKGVWLVPPSG